MSKITAFLATVGLMFLSLAATAQPTFYFSPSDPMPPLGGQITVDVLVDDFTDIVSYQYSVNWTSGHLSYVGVSNFNASLGIGPGNFGTTMTSSGKLTAQWNDPMSNPQSIPNGSVLFTITLDVVATAAVTTNILFTNNPTPKEILEDTGSGLNDITGSTVFTNTTIDIAGGGGGGLTCTFPGFGLMVESDSAATGEQVCLDILVCNFTNIESMQYTMQFNPNKLQFDGVGNFNLQNLDGGAFGTTNAGQGFITVSWFDSLGVGLTIPDETAIYNICFTAIGAGGEMDTVAINGNLAPIEVTEEGGGGANIGLESLDGEVLITGNAGSAVTVFAENEAGNVGDTVYVDVSVRNFTDMLGLQYSMAWDTAVVDFYETEWTSELPGSPTFNTSPALVNAGKLTFLWSDPLVAGVTVPDSTVIYRVGYIVKGDVDEITTIDFTDDPTSIEATQNVMGSPEVVPLAKIPGSVLVTLSVEGIFNLIVNDTTTGCTGDTINVPITVAGFDSIVSMQYDMRWPTADLDYLGVNGFNLSGLNGGSFNQLNDSTLRCAWIEPVLNPQTKADGDTIYFMQFEILAGDGNTIDLQVLDDPPMHLFEISDLDGQVTPALHTDGLVIVDCSMVDPIEVTDTLITNVLCNGDATGAIDITVDGGNGIFTFEWSNAGETSEDISGLTAGDYTVTITSGGLTEIQTYTITEPTALSATTSATDATCNGDSDGTAEVTPSGGVAPYTYLWDNLGETDPSISGLSAGNYPVTVTDANMCTVTETVIVGEPTALVLNTSSTLVSCNGGNDGTATVTPSGGSPGYVYDWSPLPDVTPTVTGLTAGSYAVTVTDASGCTAVTSVDVNEPLLLTGSATATNVTCGGDTDGSTTLTINGGTSPYLFDWDNDGTGDTDDPQNLSNVGEGSYCVTITDDKGCTATACTTVGAPVPITATAVITHESAIGANDGAIDITATGGMPAPVYGYEWDDPTNSTNQDLNGLAPGIYTVTITDSKGCTGVESFEVFEFAAPIITVDNSTDVSCNGGADGTISITVTDGTEPYSYAWDDSGSSTTEDLTDLPAGTYTVTVTDAAMVTDTETIVIGEPTAISIVMDASSDVSCNGFADGGILMTVTGGTPNYTYAWTGGSDTEDISGLSGGAYTLTVTDDNGCTKVGTPVVIDEPDPLVITVNSTTDLTCNGVPTGFIDISVSGGTPGPGYTYAWSSGGITTEDIGNLQAGMYTVTVTDDRGCQEVSNSITINQPPAINVSSFGAMVSCYGLSDGFIDLTVSGGAGEPFIYNWTGGLDPIQDPQNVQAGSYFVTITDPDGCTVIEGPIPVTQPAELTIDNVVTNASASNDDGGINNTISGGTQPYNFSWNPPYGNLEDLNGIPSGCYVVTVTDGNSCTAVDSIKVGGIMVITKQISHVSCNGDNDGSIDITVTGGITPYSYDWQDPLPDVEDQINLMAGTYCVTVHDSNGSIEAQCFTVEEPEALTILSSSVINETGAGCNGSIEIDITGGTPDYTYNWDNGNVNQDPFNLCKGDYQVTITDDNGCILISNTFTVAPPPLVVTNSQLTNVSCFGGSNGGDCFSIQGGCGPYTSKLIATGQEIISGSGEAICFGSLPAGTYMVNILDSGSPIMVISHTFTINEPSDIALNTDIINNTDPTGDDCDGSIDLTVTGGVTPYNYVWSTGATNEDPTGLCESLPLYSVTVTDANGCVQILDSLEILLGLSIVVENTTNVSCVDECDGEINITVLGGTAPYNYQWDNGAGTSQDPVDLCAGNYSVTVTDATGNTVTQQGISIAQPANPLTVAVVSTTRPIGNDNNGAINLGQPMGGWGTYSYQWSNGAVSQDIEGLVEGIFTVTVTDANGCQVIRTVNLVAQRLSLTYEISEPSCFGRNDGLIEVFVDGGSDNYSYKWNDPQMLTSSLAFGLTAGTYSVTVIDTDNPALNAVGQIDLSEPERLEVSVVCGEEDGALEAQVTGGTGSYEYLWNTPNNDTTQFVTHLPLGTFGVRVQDANECFVIAQGETCYLSDCFDAREIISVNGDGFNDVFIISCVESFNNTLRIFNRWGQLVYESTNYDNSWMGTDLDGNELPEDGYFYVLEYEDGGETIQLKGAITVLR